MKSDEIHETLAKQLQLLSEASCKPNISEDILCKLTEAMVDICKLFRG